MSELLHITENRSPTQLWPIRQLWAVFKYNVTLWLHVVRKVMVTKMSALLISEETMRVCKN